MRPRSNLERRKNRRIPTPSGLWVSWKSGERNFTSRVEDFSTSGAFIVSEQAVPIGTKLKLHFSMPEGEIQVQAIVRNCRPAKGMGVEFVSVKGKEFELILKAVRRLLGEKS